MTIMIQVLIILCSLLISWWMWRIEVRLMRLEQQQKDDAREETP